MVSSADIHDLDDRVSDLERESAETRSLATGAHADAGDVVAKLAGHHRVLEALRKTQREQGEAIRELDAKVTEGFATMKAGMEQITALLQGLADQ